MNRTGLARAACIALAVWLPSCAAPVPSREAMTPRAQEQAQRQAPAMLDGPYARPQGSTVANLAPLPPMGDAALSASVPVFLPPVAQAQQEPEASEGEVFVEAPPPRPVQAPFLLTPPKLTPAPPPFVAQAAPNEPTLAPGSPRQRNNENFDRCIGGVPGCTPGTLTVSQLASVRERWGPRDYTHCPSGWTDCDMSRRTPSSAEAEQKRDEAARAREQAGRSFSNPRSGYGGGSGGGYGGGGGCGSRGGPGFRLSSGRCASWRDVR